MVAGWIIGELRRGLARQLIGRRAYKSDTKKKQSDSQRESRRALLAKITGGAVEDVLGFAVEAPTELADDPSGDQLDALLCAIQAAWAWNQRTQRYGAPDTVDPLEGWIANPTLMTSPSGGGSAGTTRTRKSEKNFWAG